MRAKIPEWALTKARRLFYSEGSHTWTHAALRQQAIKFMKQKARLKVAKGTKPTIAWGIACHGMIIPGTVRANRGTCIRDYSESWALRLTWQQLRKQGKQVVKLKLTPLP